MFGVPRLCIIPLATSIRATSSSKERIQSSPSTITRRGHAKTYSPTSVTAALASPPSFSTNQRVFIGPAAYRVDEEQHLYKLPEPWDPLPVLRALDGNPRVKRISVDMDHMIFNSATSDKSLRYRDDEAPENILGAFGLECDCTALCKWHLPDLPKTNI